MRTFHFTPRNMSAETKTAEWIPSEPAEENIRLLAYQLWLNDGQVDGRDLDHWLTARQLLLHEAKEQHENGRPPSEPPAQKYGSPIRSIAVNPQHLHGRGRNHRELVAAGGAEQRRRARHQPQQPQPRAGRELAQKA
ncbi:MAG: hypothetical protein C0502_06345 [Opitutus sp.]|nr:hypothetical protein [Opitutus sp.]